MGLHCAIKRIQKTRLLDTLCFVYANNIHVARTLVERNSFFCMQTFLSELVAIILCDDSCLYDPKKEEKEQKERNEQKSDVRTPLLEAHRRNQAQGQAQGGQGQAQGGQGQAQGGCCWFFCWFFCCCKRADAERE